MALQERSITIPGIILIAGMRVALGLGVDSHCPCKDHFRAIHN
jgi:hypothetical protein